jgi:hypothetical protein
MSHKAISTALCCGMDDIEIPCPVTELPSSKPDRRLQYLGCILARQFVQILLGAVSYSLAMSGMTCPISIA